jgi:endoglucanase
MHNYWDYFDGMPNERDKFISMWTQLAEHYKDYPKQLFFELLNEPPYGFNDTTLGNDLRDAIAAIRVSNPYRSIIYGGTNYNKTAELGRLTQLPAEDKNLIGTIHYYSPYCYTHAQGWDCPGTHKNGDASVVGWPVLFPADYGTDTAAADAAAAAAEQQVVMDFDAAVAMSQQIGRPIYNGEFGAMQTRSITSRAAYIAAVARASEQHNIGWANWGIVNTQFDAWYSNVGWFPEIITALLPNYGTPTQ